MDEILNSLINQHLRQIGFPPGEDRDPLWWNGRRGDSRTGGKAHRGIRRHVVAGYLFCYWCVKAQATTVDHLVPLSRGGENNQSNLVACCYQCNQDKADMMPWEYARKVGRWSYFDKYGDDPILGDCGNHENSLHHHQAVQEPPGA